MKKTLRSCKKALCVFMAALMVMTAWVFFAPENAEAATAGNYDVRVTYKCTDSYDGLGEETYTGPGYTGYDRKSAAGFTIYYKPTNGTGSETWSSSSVYSTTKECNSTFSSKTATISNIGFPTKIRYFNKAYWPGSRDWYITKVEVSATGKSNWTTLWSGTVGCEAQGNPWICDFGLSVSGNFNSIKSGDGSFTHTGSFSNWKYPYVNSISWNDANRSVTVPLSGTNTVATGSATIKDQYGVEWYQEPFYALSTSSTATTTSSTITGVSLSTTGRADTTKVQVTNAAKDWVSNNGTAYQRNVYVTAYSGSVKSTVTRVTITNCQYTATFYDTNTKKTLKTQDCYYNYTVPTPPTNYTLPDYESDGHYVFSGWSPTVGKITANTTFNTVYEKQDHTWKETYRYPATCTQTGTLDEECEVCGAKRNSTLPLVDHEWKFVNTVAPTCLDDGYDYYSCQTCGAGEKRNITSALGHDLTEINRMDSSCEMDGYINYKCERCQRAIQEKIPAKGHDFSKVNYTKEPLCEKDGWATYQCVRCDAYDPAKGGSAGMVVAALGHDWGDWEIYNAPTCEGKGEERRYCKRDSAHWERRDVDPTGHEYDQSNTLTEPATCTKDGYTYHPCKHSGCTAREKIDVIPSLGHDEANAKWNVDLTPKCEVDGQKSLICPRCTNVIRTEVIEKTGHAWGTYTKTKDATCTDNAKQTAKCTNAGCTKTNTIDIPDTAKGHEFTNYVYQNDAKCEADGTMIAQCEHYNTVDGSSVRCTATDTKTATGTALGHDFTVYQSTKSAATCTKNRVDTFKCVRCSKTEDREIENTALGHDVKTWIHDTDTETCCEYGTKHGTCSRTGCGLLIEGVEDTDWPKLDHVWGEYVFDEGSDTCLANGTQTAHCLLDCNYGPCNVTNTIEAPGTRHAHTYPDPETEKNLFISNNDGTCLSNGTMTGYCKECHVAKITVEEPNSKRDHYIANWISDGNATCTEDGTKHGTCAWCGDYSEANVPDEGSALGHWFRDWDYIYNNDATCTKDGTRTAVCERCDATDTLTAKGTALGHSWSEWELDGDAATCTEGATLVRHCENCELTEERAIGAEGHDWTWVVVDEEEDLDPDCTRGYFKIKECSVCHVQDETSKKEVAAGAHHFVVEVTDATCTEAGSRVVYCDVCNNNNVRTETVIPATGHLNSELDKSSVVAATCVSNGYSGDYRCIECGAVTATGSVTEKTGEHTFSSYVRVSDPTCTTNATEKSVCAVCNNAENVREVPGTSLGHLFENYVSNDDATCTGVATMTAKCERCDATDTVKSYGTAAGHQWGEWVTVEEATCLAAGKAQKECTVCRLVVEKKLRKLSHVESEWIVDEEATCEHTGHRYKECKYGCGYRYADEIIPKEDHKYEETACSATCVDDGFSTFTCSVCGSTKKGDIVHALGHDWGGEWVVTKEATCTQKGVETLKCRRCDETKERKIAALGHKVVVDPAVEATCTKDGLTEGSHCGRCGEILTAQQDVVKPHFDGDGDGCCDECGKELRHSTDLNCDCICHKEFWLMRVWYKILRFFWKLFKIDQTCGCGAVHY